MAHMNRATHVLQWQATKSHTINKFKVNLLKVVVFGLKAAIRLHEVGIISNRKSARYGE